MIELTSIRRVPCSFEGNDFLIATTKCGRYCGLADIGNSKMVACPIVCDTGELALSHLRYMLIFRMLDNTGGLALALFPETLFVFPVGYRVEREGSPNTYIVEQLND